MIKLISEKLIRGPRPSSYADVVALGCNRVINLETGAYEYFHNDDYEAEDASRFGVVAHKLRSSDIFPPNTGRVMLCLALIELQGRTYLHCLHGKDRTGFICAAYRMEVMGWTFKEAVKEMFDLGFHKWPYIWWVPFLLKYRGKNEKKGN